MPVPAILSQCCECGEHTDNRSMICDRCAPLYADVPAVETSEAVHNG